MRTTFLITKSPYFFFLAAFKLLIISIYPIYTNYQYGHGKDFMDRHLDFVAKKSKFYNPWQYRALAPTVSETIFQILDHTVYPFIPFAKLTSRFSPIYLKYHTTFILHRIMISVVVFYLLFLHCQWLGINRVLTYIGIVFASFSMSNSVYDSDLSFNIYYDVAFYLLGGILLVSGRSGWWFVPLTALACLNRETSLFLPFMLFWRMVDWKNWRLESWPVLRQHLRMFTASLLAFLMVFSSIRLYFGFQPAFSEMWLQPGWQMFYRNLLHPVSVGEQLGIFLFLPILCLTFFRSTSYILRFLFCLITPCWFLLHYWVVFAQEARIFLVPTLLVFIPMSLQIVQQYYTHKDQVYKT